MSHLSLPSTRPAASLLARTLLARTLLAGGCLGAALLAVTASPAYAGSCGPLGDTVLLAPMPLDSLSYPFGGPAYPEGIAVVSSRVVTSGPANFGTAGNGQPSQLTVFDVHSGNLLLEVPVVGEDLSQEHALSELYADGNTLYAPSTQLGVLRWKLGGSKIPAQEAVSTPFCSVTGSFPCAAPSPVCPADVRPGLPPLPNGIVVDDAFAYVSDSLQGVIWRVDTRSTPSVPEVLVCNAALQGSGTEGLSLFGANGVAIADGLLYVSVTFSSFDAMGPTSAVFRTPLSNPGVLEEVVRFSGVEVAPGVVVPPLADGLRFHPNGNLYVVLAGHNQLVELDVSGPTAVEVGRYAGNEPSVPLTNPSTVDFSPSGDAAYVPNHAITQCLPGDPNPGCLGYGAADLFGVLEICVD